MRAPDIRWEARRSARTWRRRLVRFGRRLGCSPTCAASKPLPQACAGSCAPRTRLSQPLPSPDSRRISDRPLLARPEPVAFVKRHVDAARRLEARLLLARLVPGSDAAAGPVSAALQAARPDLARRRGRCGRGGPTRTRRCSGRPAGRRRRQRTRRVSPTRPIQSNSPVCAPRQPPRAPCSVRALDPCDPAASLTSGARAPSVYRQVPRAPRHPQEDHLCQGLVERPHFSPGASRDPCAGCRDSRPNAAPLAQTLTLFGMLCPRSLRRPT